MLTSSSQASSAEQSSATEGKRKTYSNTYEFQVSSEEKSSDVEDKRLIYFK
jgi:hypothetical protein